MVNRILYSSNSGFLMQIYAIEDKKEVEIYVPSAKEICIFYEPAKSPSMELKSKIEALWFKVFLCDAII